MSALAFKIILHCAAIPRTPNQTTRFILYCYPLRLPSKFIKMTRSHKYNDKDHAGLADGTVLPQDHLPKYFGKHGFPDADPKKTKKNGGGRANWGNAGDEVIDENFNFTNARRRSNSSISANLENLKSKFEVNEPEPVFEESMGPEEEEEKMESSSSGTSVDEGKPHKEM
ncbi:d326f827-5d60-4938-af30-686ddd2076dc [Thermothielavioides terrestris]|nr:d326f827-5d60-4938-af30-686ddd2076dc [Thermothielavioides terrestris]